MNAIAKFLRDEEGLTTVEYAIAGALVGAAVIAALSFPPIRETLAQTRPVDGNLKTSAGFSTLFNCAVVTVGAGTATG